MKTILLILNLALAQPVLAQPAAAPAPRQHPALVEFDMTAQGDMRARVQAVINRPADLSPDKVAAFEKARSAAEGGDTVAQLDLAQMLHGGEGTPRDVGAGLAWMQKSAEGGYGPAQAFLGVAYTLGQGMAIDRKLGEYWSRKGAAQGSIWLVHAGGQGARPARLEQCGLLVRGRAGRAAERRGGPGLV